MVQGVVQPAAFPPHGRALDDERRHLDEVAHLDQVRRDAVIGVVLVDFPLQQLDAPPGPRQPLVRADNADVIPHEAPQFRPVVRQHHLLVGVRHPALVPVRRGDHLRGTPAPAADVLGCGFRQHEALEQRVAGEPVGAVQARTRHFANGVQPRQIGAAVDVHHDAAAGVVCRRHHRDRLPAHVDAHLQAGFENGRKVRFDGRRWLVADVEMHAGGAEALHFVVDGACHHVA